MNVCIFLNIVMVEVKSDKNISKCGNRLDLVVSF